MRYWNKINFIIKKTFQAPISSKKKDLPKYLYATYRIIWENASRQSIIRELENIDKNYLNRIKSFSWDKALEKKNTNEKLSIYNAIPSFMIEHLLPVMNLEFLKENIQYMNGLTNDNRAYIRINNLLLESI